MTKNNNWQVEDNYLTKEFKFPNFDAALYFANQVGKIANSQGHHPDLEVAWGKVVVKTTTHDTGNQVTDKDYDLAQKIDQKARIYKPDLEPPKNFQELKEITPKIDDLLGTQKRLAVDTEFFYTYTEAGNKFGLIHSLQKILKTNEIFWNINQFPYSFFLQNIPEVQHWVLWSRSELSQEEIESNIQKRFPGADFCYFESKAKSIPEVNHVQVFVKF